MPRRTALFQTLLRVTELTFRVILMPSYVNIGAYVDEGTMVTDTWATVGLCSNLVKCTPMVVWYRWRS
jgi:hypothetical protein